MTCDVPAVKADSKYPIGKAAKLLGIHRGTLRRKAQAGEIESLFFDRLVFSGKEILRFWRSH